MEFLAEYGLFLAKTVTFLIALLIAVAIITSTAHKGGNSDEPHIEVNKINAKFDQYKHLMRKAVLDGDEQKRIAKEEKKAEKQKQKALKKNRKADSKKKSVAGEESTQGDSENSSIESNELAKKRVFVCSFDGDVKASDTENLRTLVSVILSQATKNDEIVVQLESSGGMVHSYGLASSQLARITEKEIPLTVCVDKVAASGGYMMACVADKIIAAPFAIIGSIGVIAQIPNFHKLLKKSNVDYEMHTAGEYKRTLTMFGENTDKGREKFREELEDTHVLFKDFVSEHRPSVDVSEVATGEIWFGKRALDVSLVDELKTSDQYLSDLADNYDVYELAVVEKQKLAEKLGLSVQAGIEKALNRFLSFLSTRYFS